MSFRSKDGPSPEPTPHRRRRLCAQAPFLRARIALGPIPAEPVGMPFAQARRRSGVP